MDERERSAIIEAVRKLTPKAFQAFEAACSTVIPALAAIPDTRAAAVATALGTACQFRAALIKARKR